MDGGPFAGTRCVVVVGLAGLRAEDSVTGHGRLRLLLSEDASSVVSSWAGSALVRRKRERKANIGQARKGGGWNIFEYVPEFLVV